MENNTLKFVVELIDNQLKFVQDCSNDGDARKVALGLFENEEFVNVVETLMGVEFRFYTKQGWATDDKDALIFDLGRIRQKVQETIN